MKKGFFVLLAALLLAGCTAQATDETTTEPKPEERVLLQTVTAVYEDRTVRSEYIYDGADVLKAVIPYQDDAESYRTYTTCDEAGNVIKRSIVFVGSGQTAANEGHCPVIGLHSGSSHGFIDAELLYPLILNLDVQRQDMVGVGVGGSTHIHPGGQQIHILQVTSAV